MIMQLPTNKETMQGIKKAGEDIAHPCFPCWFAMDKIEPYEFNYNLGIYPITFSTTSINHVCIHEWSDSQYAAYLPDIKASQGGAGYEDLYTPIVEKRCEHFSETRTRSNEHEQNS